MPQVLHEGRHRTRAKQGAPLVIVASGQLREQLGRGAPAVRPISLQYEHERRQGAAIQHGLPRGGPRAYELDEGVACLHRAQRVAEAHEHVQQA